MRGLGILGSVLACMLLLAGPAFADDWLPHPTGATWTYSWFDSVYNPQGTQEQYTVCSPQHLVAPCPTSAWIDGGGTSFILGWQMVNGNPYYAVPDEGNIAFQDTAGGLLNTNWSSTPPPPQFPVLCSTTDNCANSLAGALYPVIWGSRSPVLSEPLYAKLDWSSTGGAGRDIVVSSSQMIGQQRVSVPAFKQPVLADVIRSEITQAGALGDPYGSGTRTVWWVRGVGPVHVIFEHAGNSGVTTVTLDSTNLQPQAPLPDADYFPLRQGQKLTYRWTNRRHLKQPEVETVTNTAVQNRSASFKIASVSGPMRVAGDIGMTVRLTGISPLSGSASAATLVKFPSLGHGRRFITPFDLMTYGFSQLLPAYPSVGATWKAGPGQQAYSVYGVKGTSKIVGMQKVRVPAGRFEAIEVKSVMSQPHHPFGSGVRYMWFAANVGLVKLVFRHADGSVSTVELLK